MNRAFIFFLLLMVACEDNDLAEGSTPIDSTIIIEAREMLESDSRRLTFFCKTEKIYSCDNFPILTEQQVDGSPLKIAFRSIGDISLCFTALGPARTTIDFSSIPNGQHPIELTSRHFENKGTLKVTDTDITLQFGTTIGIEFVRANTKRVPKNTYWGTIGYHTPSSSGLVDEFIQKFVDAGAVFNKQAPGHYFYYEIDESGEIVTDVENSGYYFVKKFIFQYDGDESKLRELLEVEGKNVKETLSMRLETYKGEMFYNWGN